MNVNNNSANPALPRAAAAPQSNGIEDNQNKFITLLVNQIAHQDPSNPLDSNQIANQFAQMSQTTSLDNMAKKTADSNTLLSNLQVLSTSSLVGKPVMVETNQVDLADKNLKGRITLQHPSSAVTLYLKDQFGKDHAISLGNLPAGPHDFTLDAAKNALPAGKYTLNVVTDNAEENVPIELAGIVNVVRISSLTGGIELAIAGLGDVPLAHISQFGLSSPLSSRS